MKKSYNNKENLLKNETQKHSFDNEDFVSLSEGENSKYDKTSKSDKEQNQNKKSLLLLPKKRKIDEIENQSNTKQIANKKRKKKDPQLGKRIEEYKNKKLAINKGLIKKENDKKVKTLLKTTASMGRNAAEKAARAEILLPEEQGYLEAEGMEKTFKFTQNQIKEQVDVQTSRKMFSLNNLEFGPYYIDYSRTGRYLMLAGRKGHMCVIDWVRQRLISEVNVNETINDIKFLNSEGMYCSAQKKYAYIYDSTGTELHCLKKHTRPTKLEYLPYHFLLVTSGSTGYLKYHDISTGALVGEIRTKLGKSDAITKNKTNGIISLGHQNGTVTMWTPNLTKPVAKLLSNKGPVTGIDIDSTGNYLVSAGVDCSVKVWDIRNWKTVHTYFSRQPASSLKLSDTGLMSLAYSNKIEIWKDALSTKQKSPYMTHNLKKKISSSIAFCPYEDFLGVATDEGFDSILVPGSGIANFDTFEANPYQTKKQRAEATVHNLLDKIQPEMITLDTDMVGMLDKGSREQIDEEKKEQFEKNANKKPKKEKHKMRGKSSSHSVFEKRQKGFNADVAKRENIRKKLKDQEEFSKKLEENKKEQKKKSVEYNEGLDEVFDRFSK